VRVSISGRKWVSEVAAVNPNGWAAHRSEASPYEGFPGMG
jgi:hypothetical protein